MPKVRCNCGNDIKIGEIPNRNEWLLISDEEYDKFSGLIDSEILYRDMKSLLVCPNCKRLLVFWNGIQSDPTVYAPEDVL